MKAKLLFAAAAAALSAAVSSCGGPSAAALPTPTPPVATAIETAQILREAQQPSESAEPYAVNNGGLMFTDTSETTEPIAIDAAM